MKKLLCKNYDEKDCPTDTDCTFWDCPDFEPTNYFLSGIKKLNEIDIK